MKISPGSRIPPRLPLAAEVLRVLRHDLQAGKWTDRLPPERVLAEHFQVSRPILRSALAVLEQERVIRKVPGQSTLLLRRPREPATPAEPKIVRSLFRDPLDLQSPSMIYTVDELRRRLRDANYELEVDHDARLNLRHPARVLQKLLQQTPTACWVLHSPSEAVQRWFSEQRLPAIVCGSSYPGIDLPALDLDRAAIGRHAAGLFQRLKHRWFALLSRTSPRAGEQLLERGFRAAAPPPASSVVCHDGTVNGICSVLNTLLRRRERPTALLVSDAHDLLTTMGYLMHTGLRIPADIFLVCAEDEEFLAHVFPPCGAVHDEFEPLCEQTDAPDRADDERRQDPATATPDDGGF